MRYFNISFQIGDAFGETTISVSNGFPIRKNLVASIQEQNGSKEQVIILNMFEFSSEQDFNDFTAK